MSIINMTMTEDRALIVSDTEIADETNGTVVGHTSKALPIPHMPAVIAARGRVIVTPEICAMALYAANFDELDEHMPSLAGAVLASLSRNPDYLAFPAAERTVLHQVEMTAVGWSPRERRMRAFSIVQEREGAGFVRRPEPEWHVSPWPESWGRLGTMPASRVEHLALARRQAQAMRAAGHAGGGDLVFTTVHRDGVFCEVERDFMRGLNAAPAVTFGEAVRQLGRARSIGARGL